MQRVLPLVIILAVALTALADPPTSFDLRNVGGINYVTSIKSQQGGTCWTHGAMAAMEGNLLMTGNWTAAGESGEPNLAEYHLDWWNGFNQHNNDDTIPPTGGGLTVHEGGDYRVTSAYLTRGEGAVRDIDGQSFNSAPLRWDPSYHYYYPRDIEWYVAGWDLTNINLIKQKIMDEGVLGTCMCYDSSFISGTNHYQPRTSALDPNHAIGIIGWDDNHVTQASQPGAWLCKNSWGASWGESGCFWISYYDKHCCQHPEMGAISFQDVEPLAYDRFYYHDYHGWRDTLTGITEAFNAFVAADREQLQAASFFTACDNVTYTLTVYDRFEGGDLLDPLSTNTGSIQYEGFHTVDLDTPINLAPGDDFYIYLSLSAGGHPYDRTSDVPVLLGASYRTIVDSAASPGESYYRDGGVWNDLYNYDDPPWSQTANFCIKGLAINNPPLTITLPNGTPDLIPPAVPTPITVQITDGYEQFAPGSGQLHYRFDNGAFLITTVSPLGGDLYEALLPGAPCDVTPEFYFSANGDGGTTIYEPADAPTTVYTASVGSMAVFMEDDFQTDQGWTVFNGASAGNWERADPQPTTSSGLTIQPGDDHTPSGTLCFVTGPLAGSSAGTYDVDGGPTHLTSPLIDLAGRSAKVSYWRWYHISTVWDDQFVASVSNDDGATWYTLESLDDRAEWTLAEFWLDDVLTTTSQMRFRFTADDSPNNSLVEALVDDFKIECLECDSPLYPGDLDCDGDVDFDDINPFVLALSGETAYLAQYPTCYWLNADCDGDGDVDFDDINPFVNLLGN